MTGENELDLSRPQRLDKIKVLFARNTEYPVDTFIFERGNEKC